MTSPSISEVLSQTLFVGNLAAAESVKELKQRSITHILCVTSESCRRFPESFTYLVLDIYDDHSQSIIDLFDKAHQFIDSAKEKGGIAFLHCSAGVSRSGAFAISYVMKKLSMGVKQAFAFVRSKRRLTNPNFNFLHQLDQYEKKLFPDRVRGDDAPPYVVQHVRSVWPDHTKNLSDDAIARILEASRYNHIEILYNLKQAANVDDSATQTQLVVVVNNGSESNAPNTPAEN
eukprot:TRINITY_DN2255_c0_g1_i1.p1 TRINITY_DN2255_c0_g1~~TRINITY_DN2255_c0_g1_i1.p1  ORF type:complete len:232 (-),score=31.04 TRINITY_DN2255_c0_g1_i1:188-883(-)